MPWPATLFLFVVAIGTPLGALAVYPGVRRHARSGRDSAIAALMASAMCATGFGLFAAALVHGLSVTLFS